ncbi:MAG: family 10 glycosylhydrolase [Nitriliruptoraceae bacterium]
MTDRLYPTLQISNSLVATIHRDTVRHTPRRRRRIARLIAGMLLALVAVTSCATAVNQDATDGSPATVEVPPINTGPAPPAVTQAPTITIPRDVRAAWVHLFDDTLKTSAGITTMVDAAANAGVNLLIVQVARRHDAYYTSAVLPRTTDPNVEAGLDVLAAVLAAAQPRGIAVHAWYGIAPTWHAVYDELDRPKGSWIGTDHGLTAAVDDRWVSRTYDGTWMEYLDPAVPAVQRHVLAVVEELLQRYPVDGVHLDYVRYAGITTGYNPAALAAYATTTGHTGVPVPADPAFVAFRKDAVTALVRDVHALTHANGVVFSAAVISWGQPPADGILAATRTGTDALQAWDAWLTEGILDVAFPMNYFRATQPEHAEWFTGWLAYQTVLDAAVPGHVVSGVGGYLNDVDDTLAQLDAAIRSTGSVALYSWQQTTSGDADELRRKLATDGWG